VNLTNKVKICLKGCSLFDNLWTTGRWGSV